MLSLPGILPQVRSFYLRNRLWRRRRGTSIVDLVLGQRLHLEVGCFVSRILRMIWSDRAIQEFLQCSRRYRRTGAHRPIIHSILNMMVWLRNISWFSSFPANIAVIPVEQSPLESLDQRSFLLDLPLQIGNCGLEEKPLPCLFACFWRQHVSVIGHFDITLSNLRSTEITLALSVSSWQGSGQLSMNNIVRDIAVACLD